MTDAQDETPPPPRAPEPTDPARRARRWRLALGEVDAEAGALSEEDLRLSRALDALYGGERPTSEGRKRRGGLGRSAPKVARWLGDVRRSFPSSVVQVIQRDAFERLGLKQMLLEPELMATLEADIHLVADLVSLRGAVPEASKAAARELVAGVVQQILEKFRPQFETALRGARDRGRRALRPRPQDIDWPRTIRANLGGWRPETGALIAEKLIGSARRAPRPAELEDLVLCVDQSGSMATSVVYASIFAAVLASLPSLRTRLICFDTAVFDLTEELADPVEVLFGVQLGGGTDIDQAIAHCEALIDRPGRTHLVLISDLYEGGDRERLLARLRRLRDLGVGVIALLALSDEGRPAYDPEIAAALAGLGAPVFACTPDQFPDLIAAALRRDDLAAWAAARDVKRVLPDDPRQTARP